MEHTEENKPNVYGFFGKKVYVCLDDKISEKVQIKDVEILKNTDLKLMEKKLTGIKLFFDNNTHYTLLTTNSCNSFLKDMCVESPKYLINKIVDLYFDEKDNIYLKIP